MRVFRLSQDFKSCASTIPPPRQSFLSYTLIFREARADWSQIIFSPSLENFRDPASRIFLLKNYPSVSQKLATYATHVAYYLLYLIEFVRIVIWAFFL